jgi:hypothetical protein
VKIVIFSLFLSLTAQAQGLLSLRKNKEILRTYEELTGIKTDSEIQRIYDSSFLSLPKNGEISELTGFALISMLNLSQTFCQKLVTKERSLADGSRWVLNGVDLNKEVSTWSEDEIQFLTKSFGDLFWNEPMEPSVQTDLSSIFESMSQLPQPMVQSAAISMTCTAMLMSPYVYTK